MAGRAGATVNRRPPTWLVALGERLLRRRLPPDRVEEALGDLAELWDERARKRRPVRVLGYIRDAWSFRKTDERRLNSLDLDVTEVWKGIGHDARFAWRSLVRRPAFSLLAVLTLALGIGASTGIFTAVDRLLLRPLPFPDPDQLVAVHDAPFSFRDGRMDVSARLGALDVFSAYGLYAEGTLNLDGLSKPVQVKAGVASPGLLAALAVRPQIGRLYAPADDVLGANFVAMVSDGLWRRHLGGSADVLDRHVSLNGRPYRVLGVMPPGFSFPASADVWIPVFADRQATGQAFAPEVIARLKPGTSLAAAEARMAAADLERGQTRAAGDGPRLVSLQAQLTRTVRPTLILLACSVALVLLVASANVAGLLIARTAQRQSELGLRRALGCTRWRLARLLAFEAVLISSAAAAVGAAGALAALRLAAGFIPESAAFPTALSPDSRMLVIAFGVALVTGFLFGLLPVFTAATAPVARAAGTTSGGRSWRMVRSTLVVGQLAAALVLLAATSSALAAIIALTRVDLGFGNPRAVGFEITLPLARYPDPAATAMFFERAAERLRAVPGVERVVGAGGLPGDPRTGVGMSISRPDEIRPKDAPRRFAALLTASPDFFETLGIRVMHGRTFTRADHAGAPPVAILSESAARLLWPDGANPVGQQIDAGIGRPSRLEVVGVVADVKLRGPESASRAEQIYRPLQQQAPYGLIAFIVEAGSPDTGAALGPGLRQAVADVDAGLPIDRVESIDALTARFLAPHRLAALLLGGFAVICVVMAAVGLYAVLAQLVTQRTREFGIRMALGADRARLLREVVVIGARLAVIGTVLGALATGLAAQAIRHFTPSMGGPGWSTVALDAALLLVVALAAMWAPAWRASRVDPLVALRAE